MTQIQKAYVIRAGQGSRGSKNQKFVWRHLWMIPSQICLLIGSCLYLVHHDLCFLPGSISGNFSIWREKNQNSWRDVHHSWRGWPEWLQLSQICLERTNLWASKYYSCVQNSDSGDLKSQLIQIRWFLHIFETFIKKILSGLKKDDPVVR